MTLNLLIFVYWEVGLIFSSFCLSAIYISYYKLQKYPISLGLGLFLGVKLLLGAALPQWLSLIGALSATRIFTLTSVIVLMSSICFLNLAKRYGDSTFWKRYLVWHVYKKQDLIFVALVCACLAPGIASSFGPILEADSIGYSHSLISIIQGKITPLDYPAHFSALWESSYLPSISLLGSTIYCPIINLETLAFMAIGVFAICEILRFKKSVIQLLFLVVITQGQLWGYTPSGISTLKNDLVFSAATIWICLSCLLILKNSDIKYFSPAFLAIGTTFILCKFSGVLPLFLIMFVTLFLTKSWIQFSKQKLKILAFTFSVALFSNGFYYVYNLLSYGNPVAPYELDLGIVKLNGTVQAENTRIIDRLDSIDTYRYFFQLNNWNESRIGLFFPLFFFLALLNVLFVVLRFKEYGYLDLLAQRFISIISALLWMIFIVTPWTSGTQDVPYFYLEEGFSFRYASAAIILSTVSAIILLLKLAQVGEKLVLFVLTLQFLAQIKYLYGTLWAGVSRYLDFEFILISVIVFGVLPFFLFISTRWRKTRIAFSVAYLCLFFVLLPKFAAHDKGITGWEMDALSFLEKSELKSERVGLIDWEGNNPQLSVFVWPNAFSVLSYISIDQYVGTINPSLQSSVFSLENSPDVLLMTSYPGSPFLESDIEKVSRYFDKFGYEFIESKPWSLAFRKRP
jgi:hypothetical protein